MRGEKAILQLDYDTGEVIDEYRSITEAAYDNWIPYNSLSKVLSKQNGVLERRRLKFKYK